MLSEREAYELDVHGFTIVRGAFDGGFCERAVAGLKELEGRTTDELPEGCFASASPAVNEYRVYNIVECGPFWEELVDHPRVLPYVEELVPAPYRLCEAYSITRRDGIGIPLHSLWQSESGSMPGMRLGGTKYLKAVIALGDVGPDDGPMVVFAGSHKLRGRFPFSPIHSDWLAPEGDEEFQAMLLSMVPPDAIPGRWEDIPGYREVLVDAGDLVLFTEDLWHGAKQKLTPEPRRSLYLSYSPYHFPNWHGFGYSKGLLERVGPRRRHLLAGPFLGNLHEDNPVPELADFPHFYRMPNSERFKRDPAVWRATD